MFSFAPLSKIYGNCCTVTCHGLDQSLIRPNSLIHSNHRSGQITDLSKITGLQKKFRIIIINIKMISLNHQYTLIIVQYTLIIVAFPRTTLLDSRIRRASLI
jgi:hypothetical protein